MKILKFEILADGDLVDKVEDNKVYVRKANGDYAIYTLNVTDSDFMEFDVFIIKKGYGSISLNKKADLNILEESWSDTDD